MEDYSNFEKLLKEKYQFPCEYDFKFVVPSLQKNEIINIFSNARIREKSSKTGKYISFTVTKKVNTSEEIVDSYKKTRMIKNIIML